MWADFSAWTDTLAWPWGMVLGAGFGTLIVGLLHIPIFIADNRKFAKMERVQFAMWEYRLRESGVSEEDIATMRANMTRLMDGTEEV